MRAKVRARVAIGVGELERGDLLSSCKENVLHLKDCICILYCISSTFDIEIIFEELILIFEYLTTKTLSSVFSAHQ